MNNPLTMGSQLEFSSYDTEIRNSDWFYMRHLIAELQEDFTRKSKLVLLLTSKWLLAYDMYDCYENTIIIQGTPSESEKAFSKSIRSILKGYGIHLIQKLTENDKIHLDQLDISFEDIQAMVEELSFRDAETWQDMTSSRKQELQGMFSD